MRVFVTGASAAIGHARGLDRVRDLDGAGQRPTRWAEARRRVAYASTELTKIKEQPWEPPQPQ